MAGIPAAAVPVAIVAASTGAGGAEALRVGGNMAIVGGAAGLAGAIVGTRTRSTLAAVGAGAVVGAIGAPALLRYPAVGATIVLGAVAGAVAGAVGSATARSVHPKAFDLK